MRKIREAMRVRDENYLLSGIVEMDDACFGVPRKGKDGRGTNKAKAVIALSKDHKNRPAYLKIKMIDQVTIEEINRAAKQCVEPGSKIVSDGHSSYKKLVDHGFDHEANVYYKEDKDKYLKMLHVVIGNVKKFIQGTYRGLGPAYLQSYFDEFCCRFNRRKQPNEIFDRLLTACVLAEPVPVLK